MANGLLDRKKKVPDTMNQNWLTKAYTPKTIAPREDLAPEVSPVLQTPPIIPTVKSPKNLLTAPDSLSKYWGQKVGTAQTGIPLDRFVQLAGMGAKMFDPQNPIANELMKMGGGAYGERMQREYDAPNKLLQREIATAQLDKLRSPIDSWSMFNKDLIAQGHTDVAENYKAYKKAGLAPAKSKDHWEVDDQGNMSHWVDGTLVKGTGKGKSKTKRLSTMTESERNYDDYLKNVNDGLSNIPTRPDGAPLTKRELALDTAKRKAVIKVKAPTDLQLANAEADVMASAGLEENRPIVEWLNKHSKKGYTYEWQDVGQDGFWGSETVKRWVRVPKTKDTDATVDVIAERAAAKSAIDSGDFDEVKIRQQFESTTGQAY